MSDPERIGPYRVEGLLGRGGMGQVYAAWDERLRRRVALKRVLPEATGDAGRRDRLRREAQAIARLDHPAIVRIHDLVETAEGDWLVLEFAPGRNLAERLREEGPLQPAELLALARELAGALEAAHGQGLLHRDLKTENVVWSGSGAKVLDFGLAKLYQDGADAGRSGEVGRTGSAEVLGTYRAMSPEQAAGLELDPRSDLFSLGVLLYEAATGQSPFQGKTPIATMNRVCTHRQPSADQLSASCPPALAGLIDQLLEKEPSRRPPSAASFLQQLEATTGHAAAHPPTLTLDKATLASPRPLAVSPGWPRLRQRLFLAGRRHGARAALAVAAVAALAALVALVTLFWPRAAPRYVVVAPARLAEGAPPEARLALAALQAALLRSLTTLEGVVARAAEVDEAESPPARLLEVHAADEVLSSTLDCAGRQCVATLRRDGGREGTAAVQTFEVAVDDLRLLSLAADAHLREAYAGFARRPGAAALEVAPADYARYFELQRRWAEKPPDIEPLLAELDALRASSPLFVDSYLLAARMLDRRFFESRERADLDRAFVLVGQARALAPGDPAPLVAGFEIALDAGRLDGAEEAAGRLAELQPGDVGGLYRQGVLAEARGEGEDALRLVREVAEKRPSAEYLLQLARLELRQGAKAEARATLERLLARMPGHLRAEKLLAQAELESGSPARAAELYTELLKRRRGFTELSNLGLARLLLRDWPGAAEVLGEAFALAPKSAAAALNVADARLFAGRQDEAAALYARVLELVAADPAPDYWQTSSVAAQAFAHLGRRAEAAIAIQRAGAAAPDNAQLAYEAALVYTLIGEPASALAAARRALEGGFDPRWFELPFFAELRARPEWPVTAAVGPKAGAPEPADRRPPAR